MTKEKKELVKAALIDIITEKCTEHIELRKTLESGGVTVAVDPTFNRIDEKENEDLHALQRVLAIEDKAEVNG